MGEPTDNLKHDRSPTRVRYLVLAFLCSAAAIAYVQRNCIGVMEEDISRELDLSKKQMGAVMSAFFLAYAVLQLPAGWLSHIWGSRRALTFFTYLGAATAGACSLAWGMGLLVVARLGMGVAQAGLFPACTLTVTKWIPTTRRAFASGALGAFMSVGGAFGVFLTGRLLGWASWRWLFVLYALPGILWSVVFYRWFRDTPAEHSWVNDGERDLLPASEPAAGANKIRTLAQRTPWYSILTSWPMGCIAGQQFFRAAGYTFYGTWFAAFLRENKHLSREVAGELNALPLLGVVVGNLLGGSFSDWLLRCCGSRRVSRQWFSALSQFICAGLFLLSISIPDPWLAVGVITLGSLIASFAAPCAYAITIDMGGRYVAPIFSLMNMSGNIGAMIIPYLVGWIVDETGNWDLVLRLFAGIYISAALLWLPFRSEGSIVTDVPSHHAQ